jgi:hypothetical protein
MRAVPVLLSISEYTDTQRHLTLWRLYAQLSPLYLLLQRRYSQFEGGGGVESALPSNGQNEPRLVDGGIR